MNSAPSKVFMSIVTLTTHLFLSIMFWKPSTKGPLCRGGSATISESFTTLSIVKSLRVLLLAKFYIKLMKDSLF